MKNLFRSTLAIAMFMLVFALASSSTTYAQGTEYVGHLVEEFGYEFMSNYALDLNNARDILNSFPTTRSGETIYPDFIGGIYYNSEGNLVLQLVEGYQSLYESQHPITSQLCTMNIIIEYVNFSYNYLNSLINAIGEADLPDSFQWAGTKPSINGIEVGLMPHNETEIARFLNEVIYSPAITFVEAQSQSQVWILPEEYSLEEVLEADANAFPLNQTTVNPGVTFNFGGIFS